MKGSDLILASQLRSGSGGGGGNTPASAYDAEVLFTTPYGSSALVPQIISGNYASIRSLLSQGMPPNILCRFYDENTGEGCVSNLVNIAYIRDNQSVPDFDFAVSVGPSTNGSSQALYTSVFSWSAEDDINLV